MTTYVGESDNGIYAVPALIDSNTARISSKENHLLLDGPEGKRGVLAQPRPEKLKEEDIIILGYYDAIDSVDVKLDGSVIPNHVGGKIPLGITHKNDTLEIADKKPLKEDQQYIITSR